MGCDMYAVADFLDQKCIVEKDMNIVFDNLNNPNYINVLKPMMMPGMMQPNQQVIQQQFGNANPMVQAMAGQMQQQFI